MGRGNGSHNWAAGGTRPMSICVRNVLYLQRTLGAPSPGSFHPPAALKEEPEIELAHFLIAFANAWLPFEFRGAPLFPQQRNLRSASGDGSRCKTRALCTDLTITSLVRPIAGKDNAVRNEDFRTNHEFSASFFSITHGGTGHSQHATYTTLNETHLLRSGSQSMLWFPGNRQTPLLAPHAFECHRVVLRGISSRALSLARTL